jgi:DNA-binding CsgD family transcriptional regulator
MNARTGKPFQDQAASHVQRDLVRLVSKGKQLGEVGVLLVVEILEQ